MEAKEFYRKMIEKSLRIYDEQEEALMEYWEAFDDLEALYDGLEFDKFLVNLKLAETRASDSNYDIINCRVLLCYLYIECHYFKNMSFMLENCISALITLHIDFDLCELNIDFIQENIIDHIYQSFEKCLLHIKCDTNIMEFVNKELKNIQSLWKMNQKITQINNLEDLRMILLKLEYAYAHLKLNIGLIKQSIDSLKEEDYDFVDIKLEPLFHEN